MNSNRTLNARSLKVTVILDPAEVATLAVPEGHRTALRINVSGWNISANVAAKALRKAIATIREIGPDGCVALIQGKLDPRGVVEECGLVTQVKVAKAVPLDG